MTVEEINELRNEKGIFTMENEAAKWYAISKDNKFMILDSEKKRRVIFLRKQNLQKL